MRRSNRKESEVDQRIRTINQALDANPVNIKLLREIGCKYGFVNESLRALVWPRLLNIQTEKLKPMREYLYKHKDIDQVARDVDRSLWRFTVGNSSLRKKKREQLSAIVNAILCKHKELNYYQGFHDVVSILLLVANTEQEAFAMSERVALNQLRYALNTNLESTKELLSLLFPLMSYVDKELYEYFKKSGVEPFFALSWILTWFSHSLDDFNTICRLFDLYLSSHPLMIIYTSTTLIIALRDQLLNNVDCEFCAVHGFMSNFPQNSINFEDIIQQSLTLFNNIPPNKLQKQSNITLSSSTYMNIYPYSWMGESIYSNTKNSISKNSIYSGSYHVHKEGAPKMEKAVFYTLVTLLVITAIIAFRK